MNHDSDQSSTENEFDGCYPNKLNYGVPSYASRQGLQAKTNWTGQYNPSKIEYVIAKRQATLEKVFENSKNLKTEKIPFDSKKHAVYSEKIYDVNTYAGQAALKQKGKQEGYLSNNKNMFADKSFEREYSPENRELSYRSKQNISNMPRDRFRQAPSIQKNIEEDRYAAMNQLLEASRLARDEESDQISQNNVFFEECEQPIEGYYRDGSYRDYEIDEGEEEEDIYRQYRNQGNEREDENESDFYESDEDDLTYEQIIRADAIPQKDTSKNQRFENLSEVKLRYLQNNYLQDYGDIVPKKYQLEKQNNQKKGFELITLRSDYSNEFSDSPGPVVPTQRPQKDKETEMEELKRVYSQLQSDLTKKHQERDEVKKGKFDTALPKQEKRTTSDDIHQQYGAYNQLRDENHQLKKQANNYKTENTQGYSRQNRWEKTESISKNERYDLGHQIQDPFKKNVRWENDQEEEVLESYRYKGQKNEYKDSVEAGEDRGYIMEEINKKDPVNYQQKGKDIKNKEKNVDNNMSLNNKLIFKSIETPSKKVELKENTAKHLNIEHQSIPKESLAQNSNYRLNSETQKFEQGFSNDYLMSFEQSNNQMNDSKLQKNEIQPNPLTLKPVNLDTSGALKDTFEDGKYPRSRSKPHLSATNQTYQPPQILSSSPSSNAGRNTPNLTTVRVQAPYPYQQFPMSSLPQAQAQPVLSMPLPTFQSNTPIVNGHPQYNNLINITYPGISQMPPYSSNVPLNYIPVLNPPQNFNQPGYGVAPQFISSTPIVHPNTIQQPIHMHPHQLSNPQQFSSENYVLYTNYATLNVQQPKNGIVSYSNAHSGQSFINNNKSLEIPSNPAYMKQHFNIGAKENLTTQNKEPENFVTNYIKEQEELLKKLNNDKKKLAEKLKSPSSSKIGLADSKNKIENVSTNPKPHVPESIKNKENEADNRLDKSSSKAEIQGSPSNKKSTGNQSSETKSETQKEKPIILEQEKRLERNLNQEVFGRLKDIPEKDHNTKKQERISAWEAPRSYQLTQEEEIPNYGLSSKVTPQRPIKSKVETFGYQDKSSQQEKGLNKQMLIQPVQFQLATKENMNQNLIVEDKGPTLAERFLEKKKKLVEKYEAQKERPKNEEKEFRSGRTKEEILQQRKAMMEYKPPTLNRSKSELEIRKIEKDQEYKSKSPAPAERFMSNPFSKNTPGKKEPNQDLLERLARGAKAKVSKKEMKGLTSKNYELLPEIKKKKEEEKKKEEIKKRLERVKELDQKVRRNLHNKDLKNYG